jgi:hypothetical protein
VHKNACCAAGDATGSSTASVLPAQQQRQQSQHKLQKSPYVGLQHAGVVQAQTGDDSSSGSKQKHASKHGASNSSRPPRMPLQKLQQLLRERPACERPVLLTAAVKSCSSWQQAALLFADHSHEFNHVHTAALISHLPKVRAAPAESSVLGSLCALACCSVRKRGNLFELCSVQLAATTGSQATCLSFVLCSLQPPVVLIDAAHHQQPPPTNSLSNFSLAALYRSAAARCWLVSVIR